MDKIDNKDNPLGKATTYVDRYNPSLLYPINRNESWQAVGLSRDCVSFYGEDIWNAYEISWLTPQGMPISRIAEFRLSSSTPNIIESKSFKLYLNSFNQTRFASESQVVDTMIADLSKAAGGAVSVTLYTNDVQYAQAPRAKCIDEQDIEIIDYTLNPSVLSVTPESKTDHWVCSHLLKSNCPVTGQPDWGSLYIRYTGHEISEEGLLRYIVSLRQHQDFHEQCVERTFHDIQNRCRPESLTVIARYVRRGGLDINPIRSTDSNYYRENFRTARQ